MNDVTPSEHGDQFEHDAASSQQHEVYRGNFGGYSESAARPAGEVDPMLAGAQVAITNLTSQVNRAYEELIERGEQLKRREEAARDREEQAAQTLAASQRESQQTIENAQRESQQTLERARLEAQETLEQARHESQQSLEHAQSEAQRIIEQARQHEVAVAQRAEAEAGRVVERARSIEGQMARRLADLGRREQELHEQEAKLVETAQHQQAEREWLNEYAQRLTGIASDLERALGDAGGRVEANAAG